MAAQNPQVYLIVTPHPVNYPHGLTNAAGNSLFYIKFGDGNYVGRYATHNPTFQAVGNTSAGSRGTFGVPGQGGAGVGLGTFLENQIFVAHGLTVVGNGEWYEIHPGGAGMAALQLWITNLLAAFANQSFDGNGNQTSDQVAFAWAQNVLNTMAVAGFH